MNTKKLVPAVAILSVVSALSSPVLPVRAADTESALPSTALPPKQGDVKFAPDRVLVKFKDTGILTHSPRSLEAPQGQLKLSSAAQTALASINGRIDRTFATLGVVRIKTTLSPGDAIEKLYRSGTVIYAEPDYQIKLNQTIPNDSQFSDLWGLDNSGQTGGTPDADIDAPEAWKTRTNANPTIVGVVDSGVDYTHEDLAANMWTNPKEIPGNGIDDDGNGYIDDIYGIDTHNDDSDPMDDNSHGTHCSGTIGAKGNNSIGVAGVAWDAKIMALKFLSSDGWGDTSDAVDLINYAVAIKNANSYARMVLSNSWGGGGYSQTLYDAIDAAGQAGVLFVAAAGNDGLNTDIYQNYPSGYDLPNIVSVGATDHNDVPAWFSNYGQLSVDLFAPGVDILSTVPSNGYDWYSGTSMATPHVAGAAALIWSQFSNKNWKDIKRALINSAEYKSSLDERAVSQARLNLADGFNVSYRDQPSVWGLSQADIAPGDIITIYGSYFGASKGKVAINQSALTVESWSNEKIVAKVSANVAFGKGLLKVTNVAGVSNRNGQPVNVTIAAQLIGQTILPHAWASGAKVGTNTYWILGGDTYWGQTGLVERYNWANKSSTIDSSWMMPTPVTNAGAAAIGTKIYVVGGYDRNADAVYDNLQIFDTTTGTWSAGAPYPFPVMQPTVVAISGKLYVFGGLDTYQSALNSTYVYNPGTNTWIQKANMPTARAFAAAVTPGGTNKTAWVMGGYASSYLGSELNTALTYNAGTNLWTIRPAMNFARGALAGAYYKAQPHALYGSDYYGGYSGRPDGEWLASSTWQAGLSSPQMLRSATGATFSNGIHVFGGYDDYGYYGYSSNIWRFTRP